VIFVGNIVYSHLIRRKNEIHKQIEKNDLNFTFNSKFESGNLDLVVENSKFEFDLFIRSDTNSSRSHSWFYFSISNRIKGNITLNIQNLLKQDSFYAKGMRICIFSRIKSQLANEGKLHNSYKTWHRGGTNIKYKNSYLTNELRREYGKLYL